jgi:hypothetical protein
MQCQNIKSKHYPNIQCPNKIQSEDNLYCKKHSKNPIRFSENRINSAKIIQKVWKKYSLKNIFSRQGPAAFDRTLANNTAELYSLELLITIPKIYFFSFYDERKNIWAFDIRTLSFLLSKTKAIKNPYTNVILPQEIITKIQKRISWLKNHKYQIMYIDNTYCTSEQMWNQHVLDIFSKMEEAGYIVNSDWFHDLDKEEHIDFYNKLFDIWNYRIGLTHKQKNLIVSGFNSRNKLFKYTLDELKLKEEKSIKKNNLSIIERLISSSNDKTQRSLGVMYVLMGLCYVNDTVAEAYPWIYASIND